LNDIDIAILESLMTEDGLKFMELFRATRNKIKSMSKVTLSTHLKQLESDGYVRHYKNKYFLNTTKSLKNQHKDASKKLLKLEKTIDKLAKSSDIPKDSFSLLTKMFREVYTPMQFDLHCNMKNMEPFQKYTTKKNIKKCEWLFKRIVVTLEDYDSITAQNVLAVIKMGHL